MPKPIYLDEDLRNVAIQDFANTVRKARSASGTFNFKKTLSFAEGDWRSKARALVQFTPEAYAKMIALVNHFYSEIAWYGCTKREDPNAEIFTVYDIAVYPQVVTGSSVNTDEEEDIKWKFQQLVENEERSNDMCHFQGHSHCMFPVNPSSTDTGYYSKMVNTLQGDDYFIAFIINRKLEMYCEVYDFPHNVHFETKEVDVKIAPADDLDAFVQNAESMLRVVSPPPVKTKSKTKAAGAWTQEEIDEEVKVTESAAEYQDYDDFYDDVPSLVAYNNYLGRVSGRKE